jgi:hypothetical protein
MLVLVLRNQNLKDLTRRKTHLFRCSLKVASLFSQKQGEISRIDSDLFRKWSEEKIFFMTRMKEDASWVITEQKLIPHDSSVLK